MLSSIAGLGEIALLSNCVLMNPDDRRNLEEEAALDPDQAEALTAALTQNLTIIQGPPGTGGQKIIAHALVGFLTFMFLWGVHDLSTVI
jgi:hypothetical protein